MCNYLHIVRICAHEELKGTLLCVKVILMKKMKKLLIGLAGLSLSVGAAIGVGLNADNGAKEAKAETYSGTVVVDTTYATFYYDGNYPSWRDSSVLRMISL